eukprot:gnl/MRDRNA2_/MRDRNA2_82665_c0_seq1.p1 gnl/MRDRNA2_/MRDRNA2_82665_c0~~gnl/MRDRNA2_/MRDRNA2_82665_c0_seq1.p1  ORF type:complete len:309 (-),score=53.55 gnl/MRDRNA2_/MRDRNA2_82665_c0_seq1:356-1282(-)
MDSTAAKPILLASHMAAEHIRYHEQPLSWRPQGWAEYDNVSESGIEVERIGRWPQSARALREDKHIKAAFAANSARANGDKIDGCFSKAKYGARHSTGKPKQIDLTKKEQDDACGRFDKGKRMHSMGAVHKGGFHLKATLHGGGYADEKESGLPKEGPSRAQEVKAFERTQKPHNNHLSKLFARNQATPHISARERRRSEADIKSANWVLPTWNDMEYHGMKLRQGGRNRPFSANDPRNVTTNSQKLRYVLEGLGYGGDKKKEREAPWPGQRTTNGALDPSARMVAVVESSSHFANNLYKDRYSARPY